MTSNSKIILFTVFTAIILNLLIPFIISPFVTDKQKSPMNGDASQLNIWDQIMHMLYHHKQVPVSSSLIISTIILISVGLGIFLSERV